MTKSASVKAIELTKSVFESVQGGLGLLRFSVEELKPTNGSPTEESKKWEVTCSFLESLGSTSPARFKASVDLNLNTVTIEKLGGSHSALEGSYQVVPAEKKSEEKKEIIKSYGGCKECYGKGYSTQIYGEGGEGYEIAPTVHMNFCTCERGRQLKSLLLKKDN